jgi:sigma-B regulation protein RsbU (phosphoserine phosphatase)
LSVSGFPLGVVGTARYGARRAELRPGESLVLYSDGVCDAMNPTRVRYGVEALEGSLARHHALAPASMAQACLDDLAAFRSGAPHADDLTLMIARFDPE